MTSMIRSVARWLVAAFLALPPGHESLAADIALIFEPRLFTQTNALFERLGQHFEVVSSPAQVGAGVKPTMLLISVPSSGDATPNLDATKEARRVVVVVSAADGPNPATKRHFAELQVRGLREVNVLAAKSSLVDDDELLSLVGMACREVSEKIAPSVSRLMLFHDGPTKRAIEYFDGGYDDFLRALAVRVDRQ